MSQFKAFLTPTKMKIVWVILLLVVQPVITMFLAFFTMANGVFGYIAFALLLIGNPGFIFVAWFGIGNQFLFNVVYMYLIVSLIMYLKNKRKVS